MAIAFNQRSFRLASCVTSEGGAVSISVNGNPISVSSNSGSEVEFSTVVSLPEGTDLFEVSVSASDSLGKQTLKTAHYRYDGAGPVISLEQVSEHIKDHLKMPEEVRETIEYIENIDTTTIDNIVEQIKKVEEFFGVDVEFDPREFLTELGVEGGNCKF